MEVEITEEDGIDLENTPDELKRLYKKMKEIMILSQSSMQMDLQATHRSPDMVQ